MSTAKTMSVEPNVTPMIDVLLVLLIAFMVAAVDANPAIDVQLPDTGIIFDGPSSIVLEILPGPSYRINHRAVAPSRLPAELAALYARRPDRIIQMAGYPDVPYETVVAAMDIAKSAGVRVIGVVPKDAYLRK